MDQKSLYKRQLQALVSDKNIPKSASGRDRFVVESILKYMKTQPELTQIKIAELSIGGGELTSALLQNIKKLNLTCTDIDPVRIDFVKKIVQTQFSSINEYVNFFEINFDTQFEILPTKAYEVVIALDILEHVFDVFSFVSNCSRVLKKNGLFFLRVPNIAYIRHRLRLLCGHIPITASWFGPPDNIQAWEDKWGWDGGHLHYFTLPLLCRLLQRFDFDVEVCQDPGTSFSRVRNLWPALLYGNPLIIARKKGRE